MKTEQNESYQDVLESVFDELGITDSQKKTHLTRALEITHIDKFDRDLVKRFIEMNQSYY